MSEQQQQKMPAMAQPPSPEEVARLAEAAKLEENDFLKVRLLNRNMEMLESDAKNLEVQEENIALRKENIALKQQSAMMVLQEFSLLLKRKYSLVELGQIDPNTGDISREGVVEGAQDEQQEK
jgi:hypothetical protein